MNNCKCKEHPKFLEISKIYQKFCVSFQEIEFYNFQKLMSCNICEQFWIVDFLDKKDTHFALKINKKENWKKVDSIKHQKEFLLSSRGGVDTTKTCIWNKCSQQAINGVLLCINHLYETGARK